MLTRAPAVLLDAVGEGYLAFDNRSHDLHRLNPAAALIVDLCDGTRDAAAIMSIVGPLLSTADRAGITSWIEWAVAHGLLAEIEGALRPPLDPAALAELARALRRDGSVLAAFICQEAVVARAPGCPAYWSSLGELAHIIGRRDRAREAYETYLALSPADAEIEQIAIALRDEPAPSRAPDRCIQQLYARFADFYEDNMCGALDYQAPLRLIEALDAAGHVGPSDVLELGCGTGLAAAGLRPRARTLTGIDLSPQMLDHARATGAYDDLIVAEITSWLARADESFDLIVACDTLVYFGDLRQVLVPAAPRLRDAGLLAFTVERGTRPPFTLTDSGRYAHTAAHIREAASDAGLSVVSVTEGFLRQEYGEPVIGLVNVLRRT